jgi:hypothetical protein
VPGSAEASLQMPPPKPLPAEEIVTSGMVAHDKLVGSLEEGAVL